MKIVIIVLAMATVAWAQLPSPCITPLEMTFRANQYNHEDDIFNRYFIAYDAINKRQAIFEEENVIIPGRQFHEFLILNNENVMYDYNLKTKTCTKSIPRPWRNFAIPPNATFENEFSIGGPSEMVYAQEWSDRIPFRQREMWLGVFSLKDCYPIREVVIANSNITQTITTNFYDIVQGITNPDDFIPPTECLNAEWAKPSRYFY
ncbi:hypothetical protein LOTGIDRAFT_151437 [Lottia gigantea]|uniref:Mammalian ependymin-related protein 1 n=1 Tax=Lottia gigantea TaxID=225164 RepID=V4CIC5_LOTGI|nr:hypothetical protein LOTGIDRAFT_151437 [Lottia gigantea]ESP01905.1 hypothetical protein LOTGIDRAFT_151437 [Lottia gigantea]